MSEEVENNNTTPTNGVRTRNKGGSAKKARPKSTISTNSVAINIGRPDDMDLTNQTEIVINPAAATVVVVVVVVVVVALCCSSSSSSSSSCCGIVSGLSDSKEKQ
ncbi:hypothetical protein ElyMa_002592200 [Elysia marginata]|uniref:Uncharacterized protein n=1 Tax=Elysia marginata TaxID=1093978 RepID=A0AAV4GZQ1_9GAST|nr:hypothetical protein ElyMa_002592200 [Elysia marginata]